VFNKSKTEVHVAKPKLKAFGELSTIPKGRTSEWKAGYMEAVKLWKEKCDDEYVEG